MTVQIPLVDGIYSDSNSDYRTALPRNRVPVPKQTGISEGYVRPASGLIQLATAPGVDRGGINWNGKCYRVSGPYLTRIDPDNSVANLGILELGSHVTMDYSFDVLGVVSGGILYYWDGTTLTELADIDAGYVVDVVWVDGYWLFTDGTNLIVTDLQDRYSVNPLKYGSSEADPDPIRCLLKLRNEPYALNRYTIEVFQNIGGDNFPFQRIPGALISKGSVGTHTACLHAESIAFMGSARDEPPAVYMIGNGIAVAISTREIETILQGYTEEQLADCELESVTNRKNQNLYVHLPDRCLVYDTAASEALQRPVWYSLDSGLDSISRYRARDFIWCYDKWIFGDPTSEIIGTVDYSRSDCYGSPVGWEFSTPIIYNSSAGAIVNSMELVGLTGRGQNDSQIYTSASNDGLTFGPERAISSGAPGQTSKRLAWRSLGKLRLARIQKFRGDSNAHFSCAALEAGLEPLSW